MSRIKFKRLSSFFRPAGKTTAPTAATTTSADATTAVAELILPVKPSKKSSIASIVGDAVETAPSSSRKESPRKSSKSLLRKKSTRHNHEGSAMGDIISKSIDKEDPVVVPVSGDISTILYDKPDGVDSEGSKSDAAWITHVFYNSTPLRRKELNRDRKNKWIFKSSQKIRFDKLVSLCMVTVGSGTMCDLLKKLGRGTGLKEFNAFVKGCIKNARNSKNERKQIQHILEAYQLLQLMKERGFPIEEEVFGPFLLFLIDKRMEEQFTLLLEIVKDEDASLHARLGFYEMMFWIEMDDEEKIQDCCKLISADCEFNSPLHENYLLALCERDRKEFLELLDVIDITRISSKDNVNAIFRSLGRLSQEAFAELFTLILKDCDYGSDNISNLIYSYTSCLKNLAVEDFILKYKEMHEKLDLSLVAGSYEKLIFHCCNSLKVHLALDLFEEMCEAGLTLRSETLNAICHACEETCEYILVRRIYSKVRHYNLKPDCETYRSIINLNVRMKDFESAYAMLEDLDKMNLKPTASMYNAILGGYYREKNMAAVYRVLQQMKEADVKPDSQTFSFLISNCTREEDIVQYYEELKLAGVQPTRHVFMALVNAYVSSGHFEKAKEIIFDKGLPVKNLTEIKSVLVSSLANHGKIADALDIYEEMRQNGCNLEPKAIIALIENHQLEGNLNLRLKLLDELNGSPHWVDGCCRIAICCIKNGDLRSAVDLLKELADEFKDDKVQESIFDGIFSTIADMKPPDLQIGIDLVTAIKEDIGLHPSRKSLDFLLSACVICKDLQKAQLVWKEYEIAGLPHNILSLLRMYQAYLASGHFKEAADFLSTIPRDDPHVRCIIHACRVTYGNRQVGVEKKSKKKKKKKTSKSRAT